MKRLNLPKEKIFIGPALLWKRIAAFLIDLLILIVFVLFPFGKLFEKMLPKGYTISEAFNLMASSENITYILAVSFASSLLAFMYFYLLEKKMSQTIGKKLLNIFVVSDTDNLKRWQVAVRNLWFIPVFPFDLLFIADPICMLFSKSGQRLTEILSKTRVVEAYSLEP